MRSYEALININQRKVKNLVDYIAYCKYYFKPKSKEKVKFYNDLTEIKHDFPFINRDVRNDSKYKSNNTLKDFPLNWLKNEILDEGILTFEDESIAKIRQTSGVYENPVDLQNYIKKLPKYSFAIWLEFKLDAPYFSKDDDEFYIIQNPVLKETNFKVPMIRGSGWKGALAHAFRKLFNENPSNNRKKIESFLRIFGAGSENIKEIENYVFGKNQSIKDVKKKLLSFMLFELGLEISKADIEYIENIQTRRGLIDILKQKLSKKLERLTILPIEFQTHKGRAVFYPTYFDSLSLEAINPHDRKKRAGTQPIYYEVVPKGTKGIFQLIYLPFDAVLRKDDEIKNEVEEDLKNLAKAIEKLSHLGIGAKTKLGWGTFEVENKKVFINSDLKIPEGWRNDTTK